MVTDNTSTYKYAISDMQALMKLVKQVHITKYIFNVFEDEKIYHIYAWSKDGKLCQGLKDQIYGENNFIP